MAGGFPVDLYRTLRQHLSDKEGVRLPGEKHVRVFLAVLYGGLALGGLWLGTRFVLPWAAPFLAGGGGAVHRGAGGERAGGGGTAAVAAGL